MFYRITKIVILMSFSFFLMNASYAVESKTTVKSPAIKKATTTGFMQEMTEIRVHEGPDRSGKEVYEYRCKGCHGKNTQGAPMPDDKFEWSMRLRNKGMDTLLKHSMEGFNNYLMPPKGGCRNCNQKEVYAAVYYMMETSGIKLKKSDKK